MLVSPCAASTTRVRVGCARATAGKKCYASQATVHVHSSPRRRSWGTGSSAAGQLLPSSSSPSPWPKRKPARQPLTTSAPDKATREEERDVRILQTELGTTETTAATGGAMSAAAVVFRETEQQQQKQQQQQQQQQLQQQQQHERREYQYHAEATKDTVAGHQKAFLAETSVGAEDDDEELALSEAEQELALQLASVQRQVEERRRRAAASSPSEEGKHMTRTGTHRISEVEEMSNTSASRKAMSAHSSDMSLPGRPSAAAERRLREQLASVRSKMSDKLSHANRSRRVVERQLEDVQKQTDLAYAQLVQIQRDLQAVLQLLVRGKSATEESNVNMGGRDNKHGLGVVDVATEKVKALDEDLSAVTGLMNRNKFRSVPIVWCGQAQDVRVMGSFDSWTRGVHLSPYCGEDDPAGCETLMSGANEFRGELVVLPGSYEIKFLVDGQWRLAQDWPRTPGDALTANNTIYVE